MIQVAALITDLDNTLYDWVTFFAEASYAMAEVAAPLLNMETSALLAELKTVHQCYGDSEYPFALLETGTVAARWGTNRAAAKRDLQAAFSAFNEIRDRTLRLYPGTLRVLEKIRSAGCPVIAHTEASVLNAAFRLRKLHVLPVLTRVYALEHFGLDHPAPNRTDPVQLGSDTVRIVPRNRRKPDPKVLAWICEQERLEPQQVLYVGDSIARDVGMAKAAGCRSAWAKYGTIFAPEAWKRLVTISHWTSDDVARAEKAQKEFGHTVPDAVLVSGLHEVFEHFRFQPKSS